MGFWDLWSNTKSSKTTDVKHPSSSLWIYLGPSSLDSNWNSSPISITNTAILIQALIFLFFGNFFLVIEVKHILSLPLILSIKMIS